MSETGLPINAQEAFGILFALFWTAMITAAGRYHLFPTHQVLLASPRRKRARRRFTVGLLFLTVAPILTFIGVLGWFLRPSTDLRDVAAGAVIALTAFSFNRFAIAMVWAKGRRETYYDPEDEIPWIERDDPWNAEPPKSARAHALGGLLYLLIPFAIAWLLRTS